MDPLQKAGFKLLGVDTGKDAPEGVMRGDSIGQFQKALQPSFFGSPEFFDFCPPFGSTDHPAEGDQQDIEQLVTLGPFDARIFHGSKDSRQGLCLLFFHPNLSSFLDLIVSPPHLLDAIAL